MRITVTVNGATRTDDVEPRLLLAHYLRDTCGLRATNIGCDTTSCGACTVHVDGDSVKSCTVLAVQANGRSVQTAEGLAPDGELHPVQKAMVEELSPQCGFCTSGQVVSAVALLKHNPKPTVDEARLAMSGNLCRCGAYDHYLRGVMRAAQEA